MKVAGLGGFADLTSEFRLLLIHLKYRHLPLVTVGLMRKNRYICMFKQKTSLIQRELSTYAFCRGIY